MEDKVCFISYAREDIQTAQLLYRRLREFGLNPWMDKPPQPYKMDGLKPGELWEDRLREAIRSSKYFLPLFSRTSVEKSGYVQSEFRQGLLRLSEIPAGRIFVIPIRIEECQIPRARIDGISFAQYQFIDCWNGNFIDLVSYIASLEEIPIDNSTKTDIEVASASEFLEAIRPNTEIIIKDSFSLSDVDIPESRFIYARKVFDGEEIVFRGVSGLTIRGVDRPEISVSPRYATTFNFEDSHGIDIRGVALGHRPDIGECAGAVINLKECSSVSVENSLLFGCGTYGFQISQCEFVSFVDCEIFECSYGLFTSSHVTKLKLSGVDLYDSICFNAIELNETDVLFENCRIMNNTPQSDYSKIFETYRSNIIFNNTQIDLGEFPDLGIETPQEGLSIFGKYSK